MAQQEYTAQGWGAVPLDPPAGQLKHLAGQEEDDDSPPNSPAAGAGPPPGLVAAFLQSHRNNAAPSTLPHTAEPEPGSHSAHPTPPPPPTALRRANSINSDTDGDQLLVNPFALTSSGSSGNGSGHAHKNGYYPPVPQARQQQEQHAGVKGQAGLPQQQQQQQRVQKQRSFLQRLFRGLMVTGASAGLMALGAWGGSLAYRHYMAQLDDRDQLARRVTDLQKQEEKLVLRCTALEQDRQHLAAQLSDASSALSEGAAARRQLQQQLGQATVDREETVRLNLNLQRKLTTLEEQHASLSSVHKDKVAALDATLAEAARLDKEVTKLLGSVEKLEGRCGALEAANVELKRENTALAAAQAKLNKAAKC